MAIFQNQPINLETVKGVSPERFVQRAEREQQAIVGDFLRMQQGIQQGIQQFEQKREEKQNMEISLRMLKEMGYGGMSDDALKAGIKSAGGPMQFLEGMTQIQAARTPKLSAFQEKVQALIRAGFSPQEATMRAAGGQTIKVGGDDSFSPQGIVEQTYIQPIVEGFGRSQELGRKAQVGLELLEQGVETGFGQEFLMQAKKGLTAAGFGDFDISNQELFKQQIEPMMMDFIQNTKGAISEREMDLFRSWTAGLGKSVEGNRKILKAMEKASENSKVTNQMVRRYYQEKGAGADPFVIQQQVEDYLNANSIIDYADSAVQPSPATPTGEPDPESEADKILKARGL
jgi:hypothetical protein